MRFKPLNLYIILLCLGNPLRLLGVPWELLGIQLKPPGMSLKLLGIPLRKTWYSIKVDSFLLFH